MNEQIDKILKKVERLEKLVESIKGVGIPLQNQLWSVRTIAKYMDMSEHTIRNCITKRPDFPERVSSNGNPRWKASEVIAWAEGRRMKESA
jgi:predicted DNA-binding transcriptional regulator AlpA